MSKFPNFDLNVPIPSQDDTKTWASAVCRWLRKFVIAAAQESKISRGRVTATIPSATTCEEGELILYESGVTRQLYTKINGSIRYVNLT